MYPWNEIFGNDLATSEYSPALIFWREYLKQQCMQLSPYDEDSNIKCSRTDLIFTNTKINDKSKHWSLILSQESIVINRLKPSLNHGTKASKDLLIFN